MTVGAAGAINTLFRSILDPGDEEIIISPFFAEYIFISNIKMGIIEFVIQMKTGCQTSKLRKYYM